MAVRRLLTQNRELRAINAWNWTLPAWAVRLPDGRTINVCPQAGACAPVCYARNGTYRFPAVRAAHMRNLMMVMDDAPGWEHAMSDELTHRRFWPRGVIREVPGIDPGACDPYMRDWLLGGGAAVRIHDAGDFFTDDYLERWLRIAQRTPDVLFYAYTKEVTRFRRVIGNMGAPDNFRWLFSMGGREDVLIDVERERHADVFPSRAAMDAAGYMSQDASDLLAVLLPTTRIGITSNNIPAFNKRLKGRTFAQVEATRRHLAGG